MKKVPILWALIPSSILLATTVYFAGIYMNQRSYMNHTVKPYVKAQNTALDEYVVALDKSNTNMYLLQKDLLGVFKDLTSQDSTLQEKALTWILGYKTVGPVPQPSTPNKINL